MDVLTTRRILLLGKAGAGKSSLANIILGETKTVNGRSITLIDTPGFFDPGRSEEDMKPDILKCITECAPGPHAFLIVLKVEKYTEQEKDVIRKICQYFSEEAFKYAAVVFTHGDQLPKGIKIEDFVSQNECLRDLVKKCSGRCHVVDNKYWTDNQKDEYRSNQFQVEQLLKTVDKMVMENKGGYFNNKMTQAAEKESETSNKTNNSAPKNVWIKLTGPTAESVAKAFFGPAVVVLQETREARRGAEDVTAEAEEAANSAQKKEVYIINRVVKGALMPISPRQGTDGGGVKVNGRGGTITSVKPVSAVPPTTRIVIAGTAGAGKSIRVLKTCRIVLLGETGAGKSSLANIIFGEDVYKMKNTPTSGTSECQAESKSVHGRRITLIDTPSFFDTDRPEQELKPEIVRYITECAPGPHAFLIVLKVEKFTGQEQAVISKICQYFSEEAFKYAIVVFTHGDQLPEGMKIDEFAGQTEGLRDLVKKCGGRCHVVDNKNWNNSQQGDYRSNQFQVAELLNTIDKIVLENKGRCYTSEMLQAVEGNRISVGNMLLKETSSKTNTSISENEWIKLTGPASESLVEVFFGPAIKTGAATEGVATEAEGKAEEGEAEEEGDAEEGEAEEEGDAEEGEAAKEAEDKREAATEAKEVVAGGEKDTDAVQEAAHGRSGLFGFFAWIGAAAKAVVAGALGAIGAVVAGVLGAIEAVVAGALGAIGAVVAGVLGAIGAVVAGVLGAIGAVVGGDLGAIGAVVAGVFKEPATPYWSHFAGGCLLLIATVIILYQSQISWDTPPIVWSITIAFVVSVVVIPARRREEREGQEGEATTEAKGEVTTKTEEGKAK